MNKQRAAKLYELADRLSKLDVNTLSEQQLAERNAMVARLKEEVQGVAEGQTPEKEIERLKLRQNAEHGKVSLKRQAETQARIRELEKRRKQQGVAEGSGNIGSSIKSLYQKIYNAGDDEIEYFYNDSPVFAQYWDEYEGDLNSIIAEVDPAELQIILDELESYVEQANLAEADYSPMAKDSIKADKIRSLKNLIAIAKEQGRGVRVQELELELKKIEGEMGFNYKADNWSDDFERRMKQGVEEGSQRVDSLVTDALKLMQGPELKDAVQALKTVLGDRELSSRRGFYNFYIRQLMDMYSKRSVTEADNAEYDDEAGMAHNSLRTISRAVEGLMTTIKQGDNLPEWVQAKLSIAEEDLVTIWDYLQSEKESKVQESKKPSPKLTPVEMKKVNSVSEEINTEAYERLQKVFAFKNYES